MCSRTNALREARAAEVQIYSLYGLIWKSPCSTSNPVFDHELLKIIQYVTQRNVKSLSVLHLQFNCLYSYAGGGSNCGAVWGRVILSVGGSLFGAVLGRNDLTDACLGRGVEGRGRRGSSLLKDPCPLSVDPDELPRRRDDRVSTPEPGGGKSGKGRMDNRDDLLFSSVSSTVGEV